LPRLRERMRVSFPARVPRLDLHSNLTMGLPVSLYVLIGDGKMPGSK
jgi:hypothetical protein